VAPCTITFSSHYVCITKPTRAIRRLFEVGHYSNEVQRVSLARALWEKRKRTTWLPAHREAERQLCINGRRVHTDTHTDTKCQCTAPQNRHFFAAALVVFFLAKVHIENLVQWTARRDRSGCSRSLRTP
jgi:hypothetical protein